MSRWALLAAGVVEAVVLWDGETLYEPPTHVEEVVDLTAHPEVGPGWWRDTEGGFHEPGLVASEAPEAKAVVARVLDPDQDNPPVEEALRAMALLLLNGGVQG